MTKKTDLDETELDERAVKIARETLTGDIRDSLLSEFRNPKFDFWKKLKQAEQERIIERARYLAEALVMRTVNIVASGGRRSIRASLKKVTVTDGIKAEIEMSKFDGQRHELIDATGASVLIVVTDVEAYRGERAPVRADKDEPAMFEEPETVTPPPPNKRHRGNGREQPPA